MERAVLVIDLLVDFFEPDGVLYVGDEAAKIAGPTEELLKKERQAGSAVIFLCDNHLEDDPEFNMFPPHCVAGTRGAEIISSMPVEPGDRIIKKRRFSAFWGTDLEITLREIGARELVITGVCTNICVLYTSADARNLAYEVTVYRDCVSSFDLEAHEFALKEMDKTLGVRVL